MATLIERMIPFPHPLMIGMDDLQRFWAKINKGSHPKGCWLWTGATVRSFDNCGSFNEPYGHFLLLKQLYVTHRVAWFFEYREDPKELLVCHNCNTRLCIRPSHLYLGTNSMNQIQSSLEGRREQRGERNRNSKISNEEAKMILKSNLPGRSLARQFGVSYQTIWKIRNSKTFQNLLMESQC